MNRGRFITLEGGEGVGKSTQSRLLAEALAGVGIVVELTREPGGTPGAEAIRNLLLDTTGDNWGARSEALLFAAARSDHVEKRILPALDAGKWVICDRFIDSSRAYQGGGGGLDDGALLALHQIGSKGLLPDLTLLLEVPPEISARRVASRDGAETDAIGGRDASYHARVASAFARLADADPVRFRRISADAPVEDTHRRIMDSVRPLVGRA